jgi:uncharacterized protein
MFNKTSDAYLDKPKLMNLTQTRAVADFLAEAIRSGDADAVRIIFHGGEPLMVGKARFAAMCDVFVEVLRPIARLGFSVQTNAMLIDPEWVSIFRRYDVNVGVSLDGPEEINDIDRVDHQGRGTYKRVRTGVGKLIDAAQHGAGPQPGLLCVINPAAHGADLFNHFVKEVGVNSIDFLLPMETWDSVGDLSVEKVGDFLVSAFDAWVAMGSQSVSVRFFENFYTYMTGVTRTHRAAERPQDYVIVSISSDGSFGPDDALRVASDDLFDFSVHTHTLAQYLASPQVRHLHQASVEAPAECSGCAWENYCKGGSANGRVINRYSDAAGFGRKSVLCEALRKAYAHMALYLIDQGYPEEKMIQRLEG